MARYKTAENENLGKGNEKGESQINRLFGKMSHGLMDIYILFYLCIFPLCLHDKYFDILSFRFGLFWKPTLAYGIIFAIMGLLYLMCDALYNGGVIFHKFCEGLKEAYKKEYDRKNGIFSRWKAISRYIHISTMDILMSMLIVIFAISTALAEYPYEAFWGDRGRNQGLLLWLMIYIAYFLVTRFYKFKSWHIWAYLASSSVVCIWGVLNFFLYTFGMFENADDVYKYTFVSSIGNINTYNAFTGIFYGVSVGMFIKSKTWMTRVGAVFAVIIASFGQIMGLSDNVVLSTGIVLVTAPIILCENYGHVARYITAMLVYLSALRITYDIKAAGIRTMADADPGIQIKIAGNNFYIYLIVVIVIITVLFTVIACRKHDNADKSLERKAVCRLKNFWLGVMAVVAVCMVVLFMLANKGWHEEIWAPYKNILIFNDSWGTGRGLVWRLGMEFWRNDATLLMKLFGYGPDTFYIITMDRFLNIMEDAGYGMFDSAHNEYLEYFITVGILGLAAYSAFLWESLRRMFLRGNDISIAIGMGVLAYVVQATVNIAIPITTPVFTTLMFVGLVAHNRNKIVD